MVHFFYSGFSNRSNPLLYFNAKIVQNAALTLVCRIRHFEVSTMRYTIRYFRYNDIIPDDISKATLILFSVSLCHYHYAIIMPLCIINLHALNL